MGEKPSQPPRSIDVLDFLGMDFPPRRWIVEGLIQERDITMVHAWRGVGKTHFVGHLAWSVASGVPFLRYEIPEPAGVLLVDGEMPKEDLQERYKACFLSSCGQPEAPFRILCADALPEGIPSLTTPEGQALIESELEALPEVRLLILDSITTLCNGGPENEAESWTSMQEWLLKLRRRGVSPLLVHHDGKRGKQRGTSKREDVLSQVIHLKQPEEYNPSQGARFEVVLEKARGIYGMDAEPFEARLVTEPDGGVTWEIKEHETDTSQRLFVMLQNGMHIEDAWRNLGISRSTAFRYQKKWREEEKLSSGGTGPKGSLSQVSCPKGGET